MLTDGSKTELFGDVLPPGKDAELAAAIQVAIAAMGTRDMTDADKVELKAIMSAEAAQKNLAKTFLLSDRGISFGAPGFSNLRFRSVFVRWDALRPTLAPSGRATSAWTEIPVP